jgi:biopolymer transport protein ExbD
MADIEGGGGGGHKKGGKPRGKKMSTRVDFTPMVDLGFLLITFFMLTTSMSKPKTMEINMPVKPDKPPTEEEQTKFPKDRAVTLILGPKGNIFYYEGLPDNLTFETTNFGKDGIRKYLLQRNKAIHDKCTAFRKDFQEGKISEEEYKKGVKEAKADKTGPLILIKPSDQSVYKNMIDILDEMQICDVGVFAVVELNEIEKQAVEAASPTQP